MIVHKADCTAVYPQVSGTDACSCGAREAADPEHCPASENGKHTVSRSWIGVERFCTDTGSVLLEVECEHCGADGRVEVYLDDITWLGAAP